MKKRNILIIIVILIILLFKIDVKAATCTTEEKKALKEEARQVEIIPYLNEEEINPWGQYFYSVNLINFTDKFFIVDSNGRRYEKSINHSDVTKYGQFIPGTNSTFKIYGSKGEKCQYELLTTIRVSFDYYNVYYLSPLCEGIEEFDLCKKNYSGKIESEEWFLQKIEEYKKSMNKIEEKNDNNFITNIINFIVNNPLLILIPMILIIVLVLIRRNSKNKKTKIKLDLK